MIKKIKDTVLQTYVIKTLNGEEIVGIFYEKELQKRKKNQTELRTENVIEKKGDKLYVK